MLVSSLAASANLLMLIDHIAYHVKKHKVERKKYAFEGLCNGVFHAIV